jgi:serine/threonine-protein kinase
MATVHFGRLLGPVGFTRTVAVKRLHPQFARDPEFVAMFIDEARIAARIRHPNVVPTLDVVASGEEVFLVMDYVQGEPLSRLRRFASEANKPVSTKVLSSILCGVLHGLHAAHEAKSDQGKPLDIVHRDVSPQNILVGTDGISRVLDFGVAKALGRSHTTRDGHLKGKLTYMSPEQLEGKVSRRTDVFAASIVLWESLTDTRLFAGEDEVEVVGKILSKEIEPPSKYLAGRTDGSVDAAGLERLDAVVMRGLARRPEDRFETAREMALALEACCGLASPTEVGEWVEATAGPVLHQRAMHVAEIESKTSGEAPLSLPQPSVRAGDAITMQAPPIPMEQKSQASSVSVSRHSSMRPASSWSAWIVIAATAAVLVVGLGLGAFWGRSAATGGTRPAPLVSAASDPTPSPAQRSDPAPAASDPHAPSTAAPAGANEAPASPTPPASSSSAASPPAPSAPVHRGKPPPAGAPKPDCSTPYTVDSAGRQHFKEECFH